MRRSPKSSVKEGKKAAGKPAIDVDQFAMLIIKRVQAADESVDKIVGTLMMDIRRSQDATALANRLAQKVRELSDSDRMLHVRLLELVVKLRRTTTGAKTLSVAIALEELAEFLYHQQKFATALNPCKQALAIREGILAKNHAEIGRNLHQLGKIEHELGLLRSARARLIRALSVRRRSLGPNDLELAETLESLARTEVSLGDFAAAVACCEEVLDIRRTCVGDEHPELVASLNNLAAVYQWSGRSEDAHALSERVISIVEAHWNANDGRLVEPLCNLSEAALCLGRHQAAHAAAQRAVAIRAQLGEQDHPNTARVLATLASVMLDVGEFLRADELFARALSILRRSRGRERQTAQCLVNLGIVRARLGDDEEARKRLEEALELLRGVPAGAAIGTVLQNLAVVTGRLGHTTQALALHRRALDIERRRVGEASEDVGMSLVAIGKLQGVVHENAAGFDSWVQGLSILLRCDDPNYLAEAYRAAAEVLGRRCKPVEILFNKLALNILQSLRSGIAKFDTTLERTFIATREEAYRFIADRLIVAGRLPESQQVIAMIKEQELFQLTRGSRDRRWTEAALTPFERQWQQRIDDVRARMKTLLQVPAPERAGSQSRTAVRMQRSAVTQASTELKDFLRRLTVEFEQIESRSAETTASSQIGEQKDTLPVHRPEAGVALVQYLLKPDLLRIIVTTAGSQCDYRFAVSDGEISRLVHAMRSALQERSDSFLPSARRLYGILIAPFAGDLAAARLHTLAFSLDGVLRYLPMAALHNGSRYLVEDFATSVTASATGTQQDPHIAAALRGVGLGASRTFSDQPPLAGVREELAAVIRTAESSDGVVPGVIRLDQDFTADALRAAAVGGNAVLHIASHFAFAVAQEASSALQLGDGTQMTLAEFASMRFDGVDLVTLSACDTAVAAGHHQSGREVEGLGALVREQGARNVLATLWPVADLTTAAFMRAFYRTWHVQGMALPMALRHAQLSMLRGEIEPVLRSCTRGLIDPDDTTGLSARDSGSKHPYYWAPYVLMGEKDGVLPS